MSDDIFERFVLKVCLMTYEEYHAGCRTRNLDGLRLDGSETGRFTFKDRTEEMDPGVFLAPMEGEVRSQKWDFVAFSQVVVLVGLTGIDSNEDNLKLVIEARENPLGKEAEMIENATAICAVGISRAGQSGGAVIRFVYDPKMGGAEPRVTDRTYVANLMDSDYCGVVGILRRMVED